MGRGLLGSTATWSAHCCYAPPTAANQAGPAFTSVVGDGIEFSISTGPAVSQTVDVGASTIDIRYTIASATAPGTFNGPVLDFVGAPRILGATLDPATTFAPGVVTVTFDSDSVFVNLPSATVVVGSRILINLTFAS